jgi:GT2 family glycosyltransferase
MEFAINGADRRTEICPGGALASRVVRSVLPRPTVDGKYFARGGERLRVRGVTYGPFLPGPGGDPFPAQASRDFAAMVAAGVTAVRTYHVPTDRLMHFADEAGLAVFLDVPWPRHLCFLDGARAEADARRAVRSAAERGRQHPCIFAYSVGNEVPPDVVRWHGASRVERFFAELADVVRQTDPAGLVTYANYPPTEYLDLSFLDFATFNVYLHDPETFRRYLLRLQNLVGDRPLVLGELGMDTLRHGELGQAEFLRGHLREAILGGLAGTFVFSWTDDWHTGGHLIHDWAFGLTTADRAPKAALHAVREVYEARPAELLPAAPRVSVVVCTYNGGATLDQCLQSLAALEYPNFEVIVVDDGSTDHTSAVLDGHPGVRVVWQPNLGLSAARNAGFNAATGDIVAYTDSDCFADPDWLTLLVHALQTSTAAAVGGPNLTPNDGWLAACVAAAPGQPTHVLESDQVAEHVPGCNMAFRKEALVAINGFDTQFRQAGDDVDVCWRLQQAGHWITFAPGAFVWHHRRQTPRAYMRQQAGYGEAEALLRFVHPDRFNGLGVGKWRGVLYGACLHGLCVGGPIIYRGTFATGLFQCVYHRGPAHWVMLPNTLEWHAVAALVALSALAWPWAGAVAALMLGLSVVVACLQAVQAQLAPRHNGPAARLLVTALCYAQPLVRSWSRYRTRLFTYGPPAQSDDSPPGQRLPFNGRHGAAYWGETGVGRTELLDELVDYLTVHRWGKTIDSGWADWDVELHLHPWTVLRVCTAQEEHGGGRRLVRVRCCLRASGATCALLVAGAVSLGVMVTVWPGLAVGPSALVAATGLAAWWRGMVLAGRAVALIDALAGRLGMTSLSDVADRRNDRTNTGSD